MKLKTMALGAALTVFAGSALADFSGYATLTSDYDYRGFSQTGTSAALQGGLDYSHDGGFYASVWASSLDWGPDADGSIEVDYIVGFSRDFGDTGFAWDVGLLFYTYPSMSSANFTEIYGGISNDLFHFKASYSDDFAGVGESAWYFDGGFDYGWDNGFNVFAYAGYSMGKAFDYQTGPSIGFDPTPAFGVPDYWNYGVGGGWTYEAFYVDARIVGTSLSSRWEITDDIFNTETRGIVSMTISF